VITGLQALALLALFAWVGLAVFRGGFWRLREWLPDAPPPVHPPAVAVLIPARNEAATIGAAVTSLLGQDYRGFVRVTVIDDESADATAAEARVGAGDGAADRLAVIAGTPPPPGWTGKLWALEQGLRSLPPADEVPYVLFTDADIVHAPDTLSRLVAKAEAESYDLVSLMVRLACAAPWERLLIPAFVFFFRMLYPFHWVNGAGRTAGAAGGCILLRRDALAHAGGLGSISAAVIDDCALAQTIKAAGGRLWLGLARDSVSLRRYTHLRGAWAMVRRSAFTQLRHSALALAATLVGLVAVYVAPPLVLITWPLHNDAAAALAAGTAWLAMAVLYFPMVRYYGLGTAHALTLPVAAAFYGAMTADSALAHWRGQGARWKGRSYP
jgi:hopene-associated glycosyltransferase HpnB